tara:strand:+ start:1270 stop:2358 length:1089 start_codon:yes stop_codon:yes gene_type:complete
MENIFNIDIHESFMSLALNNASKGKGSVSPNPMVGCILVKDGEIISEGYHQKYGDPHAEVMAIRNARRDPHDSIAYINLEPCCISGKTPPCTEVLIENGISEVYISMLDPNPRVNGKGVEQLNKAGIKTHVGLLEESAMKLNQGFSKWICNKIPFVIAKVAQSSNGFMGIDSNSSVWLTGESAVQHTHNLRANVDAILIGRQTALIDNPSLTVRNVNGVNPKRIILDTNRTLPLDLNIFNDKEAETIVLCSNSKFNNSQTHFCKYISVEEQEFSLSPHAVLKAVANEGITSLLIEGGRSVLESFQSENLIDKIYVYTSSEELHQANLKNPIVISNDWQILKEESLGDDTVLVAKKGEQCLQV